MRFRTCLLLCAIAAGAGAAPFIPSDDAQVLERMPERTGQRYREVKQLRTLVAARPGDPAGAAALATAYYRIAREEGDPRYFGYAQAALAPWWKQEDAPTPVVLARATLLQSNHEFDRAVADLTRVLAREPRNGRALVLRSSVLIVQGKYADARTDCARLPGVVPEFYARACLAGIDALTGNARAAAEMLQRALAALPAGDASGRAFGESLAGEIAHRRGDAAAERHFKVALAADPRDLYTLGAYSDWLLDQGRPAEVVALVQSEARVDALLLRLALAQKMQKAPGFDATRATLRARFAASRARGDSGERRGEARFALELDGDAGAALRLARDNWAVQREPADLRILAEAAAAAGDARARDTVRRWLADTGLEYAAVARIAGSGAQ